MKLSASIAEKNKMHKNSDLLMRSPPELSQSPDRAVHEHKARTTVGTLMPNPSLKGSTNGRPPGPAWGSLRVNW